jgi:hypothetical protein
MSRFSELLSSENIDPRRILVASAAIERLRPEDRRAHFLKRKKKAGGAAAAPPAEGEAPAEKPRSGRVVTREALRRAQEGLPLSGPEKSRLVRALNRVLEQKKKDAVDVRKLFPSSGPKKSAEPAAEAVAES